MFRRTIINAVSAFGLMAGVAVQAGAAEIQVLSTPVMLDAMEKLIPEYQRMTGNTVVVKFAISPAITKQIAGGQASPDVAIITGGGVDELVKQSKVLPDSNSTFARTSVALAVRAGAPKPDISSVEAVKRTLLNAKSIAYTDPATGAATGVHMAKILAKLGIAADLKSRTVFGQGSPIGEFVAKGDAEIGFQQLPELMPTKGIDIVGLLPEELQNHMSVKAGVVATSKHAKAAESLVKFLSSPAVAGTLKDAGMEAP
jgi:molybdate transport system substrate-binding protein